MTNSLKFCLDIKDKNKRQKHVSVKQIKLETQHTKQP